MTRCIVAVLLLLLVAAPAFATTIVVPYLEEPVEVKDDPPIRIVAHGPHSATMYRITIEIENTTTCTLKLSAPAEALYLFEEDDELTTNTTPARVGTVWFYNLELQNIPPSPVRRMRPAFGRYGYQKSVDPPDYLPRYRREIEIEPRRIKTIDLDFDLPPIDLPAVMSLGFNNLDLGCGVVILGQVDLRMNGREQLARYRRFLIEYVRN